MKPKIAVKLAVDILMTVLLLLLMGYQFWGEAAHEWIGAGMFLLFVAHHLLNQSWHKNIFKGKYTVLRAVALVIDVLLLICVLAQMYSGIVMSRYVFRFLSIEAGMSFARRLHILAAFWGFLLLSLHLGLHWNMFVGMLRNKIFVKQAPMIGKVLSAVVGILIAGYGAYAFIQRDISAYLFLKSAFVFLDYSEPKVLFYVDYLALMGLCIFIAHYGLKLYRQIGGKRRKAK